MRVLMLGWEFPPFISGGLGTACFGLTKALSRQQVDVLFVLPKPVAGQYTSHVKLLTPQPAPRPQPATWATIPPTPIPARCAGLPPSASTSAAASAARSRRV